MEGGLIDTRHREGFSGIRLLTISRRAAQRRLKISKNVCWRRATWKDFCRFRRTSGLGYEQKSCLLVCVDIEVGFTNPCVLHMAEC